MKFIQYNIILLTTVLFAAGCNKDFLNRSPKDVYTDNTFWTTQKDVVAAINGCYYQWESPVSVLFNDCFTDNEAYSGYGSDNYELFTSGLLSGGMSLSPSFYTYQTIYACNWFLENIDKADSTIADAAFKTRTKAEARFLRAYRYFILTQFYRDVPLVLHTGSQQESRTQKQATKQEITDLMLKELAAIAPDLPVSYVDWGDQGRITRGAALALKARIELYNKKYSDCIATCNQLMAPPFNYALYDNFQELFRPQIEGSSTNHEVILDVQCMMNYNAKALNGIALSPVGQSQIAITQSLVDEFETINGKTIQTDPAYDPLQPYKNRDPRLDATVIRPGLSYNGIYFDPITPPMPGPPGPPMMGGSGYTLQTSNYKEWAPNPPTGYGSKKYLSNLNDYWNTAYGSTNLYSTGGNVIVIRYAEVLLTYAEAKIETGQIDASVYDAINLVRQRAGMPAVSAATHPDQQSLRQLVRRERRVEFAGEGLRWFDIVRWQIGPDVIKDVYDCLDGTVDQSNGNLNLVPNSSTVKFRRQFTPKYYVMPFLPGELSANPNLVQNLEYR
jgi:hypothetical protein